MRRRVRALRALKTTALEPDRDHHPVGLEAHRPDPDPRQVQQAVECRGDAHRRRPPSSMASDTSNLRSEPVRVPGRSRTQRRTRSNQGKTPTSDLPVTSDHPRSLAFHWSRSGDRVQLRVATASGRRQLSASTAGLSLSRPSAAIDSELLTKHAESTSAVTEAAKAAAGRFGGRSCAELTLSDDPDSMPA